MRDLREPIRAFDPESGRKDSVAILRSLLKSGDIRVVLSGRQAAVVGSGTVPLENQIEQRPAKRLESTPDRAGSYRICRQGAPSPTPGLAFWQDIEIECHGRHFLDLLA